MNTEYYILIIPVLLIIAAYIPGGPAARARAFLPAAAWLTAFVLALTLLFGGAGERHILFTTTGVFPVSFAGSMLTSVLLTLVAFVQFCLSLRRLLNSNAADDFGDKLKPAAIFLLFSLALSANLVTAFAVSFLLSIVSLLYAHRSNKSFSVSKLAVFLGLSELILFSAVIILYFANGSFEISLTGTVQSSAITVSLAAAGSILLVLAPAAKAMLFPFHFWFTPIEKTRESGDINYVLSMIIPSGIILYLKAAPAFNQSAQITLIVISTVSILYSVFQSLGAKSKDEFIKSSIMADTGLVVLAAAFGNYGLALFLFAVFTISRLLLARTSFENEFKNPVIGYWYTLGAIMLYAGIPITAKFAGYSYMIGSSNEFNSVIRGTGIIFPVAAFSISFVSSFKLIGYFLDTHSSPGSPDGASIKEDIIANADMLLLGAASLFFWYVSNPFYPAGIWLINSLASESRYVLPQSTGGDMGYLNSLIAFSAAGLGVFFGYLTANKNRKLALQGALNSFENRIDTLIGNMLNWEPAKVMEGTKTFRNILAKRFDGSGFSFSFSVMFLIIVLFYFIFRSM